MNVMKIQTFGLICSSPVCTVTKKLFNIMERVMEDHPGIAVVFIDLFFIWVWTITWPDVNNVWFGTSRSPFVVTLAFDLPSVNKVQQSDVGNLSFFGPFCVMLHQVELLC